MQHTYCIKHLFIAGICLALMPGPGCKEETPSTSQEALPPSDPNAGYVAFVGAGKNDPLTPILKNSAERYARDLGRTQVRFFNPDNRSTAEQIALLEKIKEPRLQGLCVQIIDPLAMRPVLESYALEGITVVSMIEPAPEDLRVAHVGYDEKEIGQKLAEATAIWLNQAGDIMLLTADPEHPVYGPRGEAFLDEMKRYPDIHLLAEIDCHGQARMARKIIRERSERFPRLSAWVALDDWPIRDLPPGEKLFKPNTRFITFGGTPRLWPLLQDGTCPVLVCANYHEMGARALMSCLAAISQPNSKRIDYRAPLRLIWPTNLEQHKRDWTLWSKGQYIQPDKSADIPLNDGP